VPIREYKPDKFFRASIDMMDDAGDCKTYVAEYFSWKVPRHGEAVSPGRSVARSSNPARQSTSAGPRRPGASPCGHAVSQLVMFESAPRNLSINSSK
jgi:hypothetical protein